MNTRPSFLTRLHARLGSLAAPVRHRYNMLLLSALLPRQAAPRSDRLAVFLLNEYNVTKTLAGYFAYRDLVRAGWTCTLAYETPWYRNPVPKSPLSYGIKVESRNMCSLAAGDESAVEHVVDIDRHVFTIEGIDFFPLLAGTLANMQRRYAADFADPSYRSAIASIVRSALAAFAYCRLVEREAASMAAVRLVLADTQTIPNGVIAAYFVKHFPRPNISVYVLSEAYSMYYERRTASCDVMLKRVDEPTMFGAYHVDVPTFRDWYGKSTAEERNTILEASSAIFYNSPSTPTTPARAAVEARVKDVRERGGKVFCLFGHLIYDRPYDDDTPAFGSMPDWARQTVELFRGRADLLLIKPHPAEWRLGTKNRLATLRDALALSSLPDNVVFLPADAYNVREISSLIDGGLIWRSTALLELTILGVPTLFCGPQAPYQEAMAAHAPTSREDYARRLDELPAEVVAEERRQRAAAVIYFLNHTCVIPVRPLRRLPILFGDNAVISPLRLARVLRSGTSGAPELARALLGGLGVAIRN